jgi:hypothetical protein
MEVDYLLVWEYCCVGRFLRAETVIFSLNQQKACLAPYVYYRIPAMS